jgi:hypothetical protein
MPLYWKLRGLGLCVSASIIRKTNSQTWEEFSLLIIWYNSYMIFSLQSKPVCVHSIFSLIKNEISTLLRPKPNGFNRKYSSPNCLLPRNLHRWCFKTSFTTLKAYINLFRGHIQCFELSWNSKTRRVLPGIAPVLCLPWVMQGVSKKASQWCSKCYCVVSFMKKFVLKGVQTIHRSRYMSLSVNVSVPLATE